MKTLQKIENIIKKKRKTRRNTRTNGKWNEFSSDIMALTKSQVSILTFIEHSFVSQKIVKLLLDSFFSSFIWKNNHKNKVSN